MTASAKKRPDTRCNAVEPAFRANPSEGKALMNNQEDSTVVPKRTEIAFRADTEWLRQLEIGHAIALYDALNHAIEWFAAVRNQPRFASDANAWGLNAAGDFLEDLESHLAEIKDCIIDGQQACNPSLSPKEFQARAWLRLRADAKYEESLGHYAATAAILAADLRISEHRADSLPVVGAAR